MHTNSLPPTDRAESINEKWTADEDLRAKLTAYRDRPQWSNNTLARNIGVNVAVISCYLAEGGAKAHGDMLKFERKAWDFVRNEERRRASGVNTANCELAEDISKMIETTRANNAIAEILGPSGYGKTRGIELYTKANPTSILYTARTWCRDVKSIEGHMFSVIGRAGYDNRSPRAQHMVKQLLGSNRVIIIDNAEYLTIPAIHWLYDFAEETQCPMPFFGTYKLCDKLESDDRRASRTFLRFELKPENPRALILHLIKELAPDANGETGAIYDLCEQIAAQAGHFRSVHQQLKLAGEMRSRKKLSWVQAINAAHGNLIRNYNLN